MLSPPKPLGGIQPNLLYHFPSWKGCARATLFFHSCFWCLSICPSCYLLLNHWAEFDQTCVMTSPLGKGEEEQVHSSFMLLATLATNVGICDGKPSTAHSSSSWFYTHFMCNGKCLSIALVKHSFISTLSIQTDRPEQTVMTQIRCHIMWHLIRVYTVCFSSGNF